MVKRCYARTEKSSRNGGGSLHGKNPSELLELERRRPDKMIGERSLVPSSEPLAPLGRLNMVENTDDSMKGSLGNRKRIPSTWNGIRQCKNDVASLPFRSHPPRRQRTRGLAYRTRRARLDRRKTSRDRPASKGYRLSRAVLPLGFEAGSILRQALHHSMSSSVPVLRMALNASGWEEGGVE